MPRLHFRPLFVHCLIMALLCLPFDSAADELDLLVLVDCERDGVDEFWWSTPEQRPTEFDSYLLEVLRQHGTHVYEPQGGGTEVRISRIYRRRDLTVPNAINLAELFQANVVLRGTITIHTEEVDEHLWSGQTMAVAVFSGRLFDTANGLEIARIDIERVAFGIDGELNVDAVIRQSADAIGSLVSRASQVSEITVGVSESGPHLMLSGMVSLDQLQRILGALKTGGFSARLDWIAQGIVGLSIEPHDDLGELTLRAAAESLVSEPPELQVTLRSESDVGILLDILSGSVERY